MATTDETYRIILRVEGEAQVAKLTAEIQKEERAMLDLTARLKQLGATQDQVLKAQAVYAQSIANLNQQLAAANKQVSDAGGKFQNLSNGLVQLGYAVDDAQYGMKGLANNIQPLLMSLGLGGGLAGIIGIVVTATVVLTDKWDKLMGLMGMGKVRTQAEEMEELAKATERTLEQEVKLEEYQERKAAGQRLKGGMPKAEREARAAAEAAINEAGGNDRIAAGIRAGRNTGVDGLDPTAAGYEQYVQAKERFTNPGRFATVNAKTGLSDEDSVKAAAAARMKELKAKNQTESKNQIEELFRKAVTGDQAAMKTLVGEIRANPGAFPPNALRDIQKGTADGQVKDRLDTVWKNAKMQEGEDAMERTAKAGEAWRINKMKEGEDAMGRQAANAAAEQEYFNNVREGPDAETRAFLDNRQRNIDAGNATAVGRRQRGVQNLGGNQNAFTDVAAGLLMQGMPPEQVQRMLQERANNTVGMIPGIGMVREAMTAAQGSLMSMQYDQMKEAMGPRQLHGFAAFKDALMTSDPNGDAMRKQFEAASKANDILGRIEDIMRTRTFPTIVN